MCGRAVRCAGNEWSAGRQAGRQARRTIGASVASVAFVLAGCSGELPGSIERSAQYSSPASVPGDAACGPAEALCGDTCARLDTDPRHCGRCDLSCADGQVCFAGTCGAPPSADPPGSAHFPYYIRARPAVVTVAGIDRIFAVVGAGSVDDPTRLVVKTPTSDWLALMGGPDGHIQPVSGAAGATVDTASVPLWGGQAAVYVRSDVGHLWQAAYGTSGTGPGWTDVSNGGPLLFDNQPLVAAWLPRRFSVPPVMVVATLIKLVGNARYDEVRVCTLPDATTGCQWRNLGAPGAARIVAGSELALDTSCPFTDLAVYTSTETGELARFALNRWDVFAPSDPDLTFRQGNVHGFTVGSTCYALAAATSASTGQTQPVLFAWDGVSVTSTNLGVGAPFSDVAYQLGNFAHGRRGSADLIWMLAGTARGDHPLWQCALSGGLRPRCSWTALGRPPDEMTTRFPLGFALMGAGATVYTTGFVGATAVYVFGHDGTEWQNHLTLRDATTFLPAPTCTTPTCRTVGELVATEYDGTVVYAAPVNQGDDATGEGGAFPHTWISQDDGSTMNEVPFPPLVVEYPRENNLSDGDFNLVTDVAGRAYLSVLADVFPIPFVFPPAVRRGSVQLSAMSLISPTLENWSPPSVAPPTQLVTIDRPWLAASAVVPGQLLMTYIAWPVEQGSATFAPEGRFAYCNGPDCSLPGVSWCPADAAEVNAYVLPSSHGCGLGRPPGVPEQGLPGCQVQTDSSGEVYVTVSDDVDCTHSPYGSDVLWTSIGIHRFDVPRAHYVRGNPIFPGCLSPTNLEARLGRPIECIYYVYSAFDPASQCNGGLGQPCDVRRWGSQFRASQDARGVLAVTVQAYHEVPGTGSCPMGSPCPCTSTSRSCRADQMLVWSDGHGSWCGATSCTTAHDIEQTMMLMVNSDRALPLRQEDHIVPALAALDNMRFGMSWVDFRTPSGPPNFSTFAIASAMVDGRSTPRSVMESSGWVGSDGVFVVAASTTVLYGDINMAAAARGHAHFVNTTTTPSSDLTIDITSTQSPFAVPR